ncbi:MAG: helix-turn-helix transcriptional regulator [Lachnospiraceae bacterium]|nr:helix-turn-helix transcriptional regulator [Lachnospiraceae bacterium]
MSRIVFQNSYLMVVPSFVKTESHKHPMMHIFLGKNDCRITVNGQEYFGRAIVVDSNVKHIVKEESGCDIIMLIDPTCDLAEQLRESYLCKGVSAKALKSEIDLPENLFERSDPELVELSENLFEGLGVKFDFSRQKDERIEQVIEKIISGEWLDLKIKEIADNVYLSESRLTHLFKEEAGISLKSYILIHKMEHAYKYVNSGGKITQAAHESGFASSAHLAYTCKTLTGISIRDVLKNSRFLKV